MFVVSLLFFVKQMTAYEMRISDWSSDVCSSDLHPRLRRGGVLRPGVAARRPAHAAGADRADIAEDILEEAAVAAEGRRLVAFRIDLAHQFEPGSVDGRDIAGRIEADAQHLLRHRTRIGEDRQSTSLNSSTK